LPLETIRAGLASFDSDPERTPGRFNVLEADGATVILDFAHNPSAMQGLVESLPAFPGGRRTLVLSAPGDRSDSVIIRQARILADAFDEVILYDEESLMRGRGAGEINDLLRRGLAEGSRVSVVREVHGERAAIARALDCVRPGDLLLILLDDVEMSLPFVRECLARKADGQRDRLAVTSTH
jgi:cyanophycin synthetase